MPMGALPGSLGAPQGLDPTTLAMMQPLLQAMAEAQLPEEPKKPKPKKPSMDWIMSQAEDLISHWRDRNDRMFDDEDFYRMLLPKDIETAPGSVIQKNTPYVIVEKVANMLGHQWPRLDVIPPENIDSSTAYKIEDYLRWQWDRWDSTYFLSMNSPLLRSMVHYLALRGWFTARVNLDHEHEVDDPPIELSVYDPVTVYPMWGKKRIRFVIQRYDLTRSEALDEWPEYADVLDVRMREANETIDLTQTVEVTHYFDDWWHAVYIDGQEVKEPTEHGYGFLPWLVVTAGGSPIRTTTRGRSRKWVRDIGPSLFHGIKDQIRALNRLLSKLDTQVDLSTNPPLAMFYDPANPNEPPRPIFEAGATNYFAYDRERMDIIQLTSNPNDLAPLMQNLVGDIEAGGLPQVLFGSADPGMTGFAISLLQGSARDSLFGVIKAMERSIEEVNRMSLVLIRDHWADPIPFYSNRGGQWRAGLLLYPAEVEQVGTLTKVEYKDVSPQDRSMMANLAALLTDKKLISLDTARSEYLEMDNPERENERVLSDLIYLDEDVVKHALIPRALERVDADLYAIYMQNLMQQKAMEQAQQQQAPQQGAGGLPPDALSPHMQPGMDHQAQSRASAAGGAGVERPPGVAGAGALPMRPPIY